MPLYKYIKKKDLLSFFSTGSLKIGTMYDYRKVETYGSVIGDQKEGYYETVLSKPEAFKFNLATDSAESRLFKGFFGSEPNPDVELSFSAGTELIIRDNSPDLYLYCMSKEFNYDVMKQFECDCCIVIENPTAFIKEVSRVIRHKAEYIGINSVVYGNKRTHYTTPHDVHPSLMKEEIYAPQKEVRAAWIPKGQIQGPLFVNVRKAIKYCKQIKIK
ncbi:hypothetical protein [Enterobacter cloacae]|uniref:hypothetical protein n=1 Tax=Enterobacter cloacae TaxID=550 RepID=UPI00300D19FF